MAKVTDWQKIYDARGLRGIALEANALTATPDPTADPDPDRGDDVADEIHAVFGWQRDHDWFSTSERPVAEDETGYVFAYEGEGETKFAYMTRSEMDEEVALTICGDSVA
jgi:hypothetical protein